MPAWVKHLECKDILDDEHIADNLSGSKDLWAYISTEVVDREFNTLVKDSKPAATKEEIALPTF